MKRIIYSSKDTSSNLDIKSIINVEKDELINLANKGNLSQLLDKIRENYNKVENWQSVIDKYMSILENFDFSEQSEEDFNKFISDLKSL